MAQSKERDPKWVVELRPVLYRVDDSTQYGAYFIQIGWEMAMQWISENVLFLNFLEGTFWEKA